MSDYHLRIDTPENLTLESEVAGFGSRCLAALVDYVLIFFGMFILAMIMLRSLRDMNIDDSLITLAFLWLIGFLIFFFYHLLFEILMNGQTPGKRLFNIRIVQQNGMPATTTSLLVRNIVRLFDYLPVFYGVGLVVMFASKHTQRLGDMAARTVAVYARDEISLKDVQKSSSVAHRFAAPGIDIPDFIDVSVLDEQDRHLIVEVLHRSKEIHMPYLVTRVLTSRLVKKMNVQQNIDFLYRYDNAEKFLELVMRALEKYDLERQQAAQLT